MSTPQQTAARLQELLDAGELDLAMAALTEIGQSIGMEAESSSDAKLEPMDRQALRTLQLSLDYAKVVAQEQRSLALKKVRQLRVGQQGHEAYLGGSPTA